MLVHLRGDRDIVPGALSPKNLAESRPGDRVDLDLVFNTAYESFFRQLTQFQIRREDHHYLKGNSNPHAGPQRVIVHAAMEGYDPPVQKIARADVLAAEVVDHQDSFIGL